MANLALLASDEGNPEFMGARNPDSLLHVRFYERALQNNFRTEQEGRPIFDTIVFLEIHTPGNQLNVIDRPKRAEDEHRFRAQWQFFKDTHSDDPAKQGTPLSQWPLIDVAKAEMLKAQKFFSVEQIAFASDEQIKHLGMMAGMDPYAFRDRAKAYLAVARDSTIVTKQADALKASEDKIAAMETAHKEEMDALNAKLNAVLDKLSASPSPEKKQKRTMTAEHKAALKAGRERKSKQAEAPAAE